MARKKAIAFDAKQFLKMAKEKVSTEDLMKTFGFKTTTQVKAAHYKALIEAGGLNQL